LLGVEGEAQLPLKTLPLAVGVKLFQDRSKAASVSYRAGENSRATIEDIVRSLDGLSLAIELAAARSAILSPAQILERLQRRFDLLSSSRRDLTPRQATLWGAITWSWDLLEPWEAFALAQCSVFRGGLTLAAAEEVLDLSAWPDAPWLPDVVQRLVEKSLLQRVDPAVGPPRFVFYESIREFAAARLVEEGSVLGPSGVPLTGPGELLKVRGNQLGYFAGFGSVDSVARLATEEGLELFGTLVGDVANLRKAIETACATNDGKRGTLAAIVLCTLAHRTGTAETAIESTLRVLPLTGGNSETRSRLLCLYSKLLLKARRGPEALENARKAVELAAEARVAVRVDADLQLAILLYHLGRDRQGAWEVLNRWLEQLDPEEFPLSYCQVKSLQARILVVEGRPEAEAALAASIDLSSRSNLVDLLVRAELAFATWKLLEGEAATAVDHFGQAVALAKRMGDVYLAVLCSIHQAMALLAEDELAAARSLLMKALSSSEKRGDHYCGTAARLNLAHVLLSMGDLESADDVLGVSVLRLKAGENPEWLATAHVTQARIRMRQGLLDDAGRLLELGSLLDTSNPSPIEVVTLRVARVELKAYSGDVVGARAALEDAESFCKEHKIRERYALRLLRGAREMTRALESSPPDSGP
jgi:tetratricopeptide (TPR) repeat protein